MAASDPWWVIATSTLNGKPYQAATFQGTKAAASGAGAGGIISGPYSTQAAAAAALSSWQQKAAAAGGAPATAVGPVGAFSSVQNALSGFYDVITNGKMWRSLGWVILGILLMISGLGLLLKNDIAGVVKAVA